MDHTLNIADKVRNLVEPVVSSEGMECVDVELKMGRGEWRLRIYIDKEGGITHDDCANISRQVGEVLEVEDVFDHSYVLEVSSPGLDRPLKNIDDYRRFSGKLVKLKTFKPIEGKKVFIGKLKGVEEDRVVIEEDGDIFYVPLETIAKGRLEVEF